MLSIQQTLIFLVIFTFWVVRLYYKLYDAKIRKYVMIIGFLIVFWMLIRINKGLIEIKEINRIFWYLYYIPLIFIPSFFNICVLTLLNKATKTKKIIIFIISSILLLLILTNDLHQFVFKFPNGINNYNDYKHFIGYYITCVWIFYLFGKGLVELAISKIKIKKDFKAFSPLVLLILGILYTYFYVMNIPIFRTSNLSIILSVLICIGIELILYLDLIPNNSKYKKTFENSHLDMIVISLDSDTMYSTKSFKKIPKYIYDDIKSGRVRKKYKEKNYVYDIKTNKDSFVCFKKNIYELNVLKKKLRQINKELLLKQKKLKNEETIKKELYEIKLREEIVLNLEKSLKDKKMSINKILNKDKLLYNDLEKIKLLVSYCKRKSSLIISELNSDTYNEISIQMLIKELLADSLSLGIKGEVIVSKMKINSYQMSLIYDVVFSIIENISSTYMMIFIDKDKDIAVKIILGNNSSIKAKLKYDKNITCKEKIYDNDIELFLSIKEEKAI